MKPHVLLTNNLKDDERHLWLLPYLNVGRYTYTIYFNIGWLIWNVEIRFFKKEKYIKDSLNKKNHI